MTFHKYHKIRELGHEENKEIFLHPDDKILIEEKIDGANFRFMITDDNIVFGSRTQELLPDVDHKFQKNFERCIHHVKELLAKAVFKKEHRHKIYYGECCVKHTMNYDWEKMPPFLGFDIKDIKEERYVDYTNRVRFFTDLGLQQVPLVEICTAKEILEINDDRVPESYYASPSSKDTKAEGIVFKNYDKQIFAKYVRDVFKEKNAEIFGGSPKFGVGIEATLCLKYCTNARIDKNIFKLLDDDEKLELGLMKLLPNKVFKDIWEEHWEEIILDKKLIIDVGNFKKLVTKRCLSVLKQVVTNNALNGDKNE